MERTSQALRWVVFVVVILLGVGAIGFSVHEGADILREKYYIHVGTRYRDQEKYDDSIAQFNKAIAICPWDAAAYYGRGYTYVDKGEYDAAIADCTKAIQLSPKYEKAYWIRAFAYQQKREYDKAIADDSMAIQLSPRDSAALVGRGNSYYMKGEYKEAIADYSEEIRLSPDWAEGYEDRGMTYRKDGEYAPALADFNRAIQLKPGEAYFYVNRGRLLERKGEFASAIEDYSKAISLNAMDADAFNLMGWILATCSDASVRNGAKAVEYAKKACDLSDWHNANIVLTLAAAYAEAGNFDSAINTEQKYLKMDGLSDEARKIGKERMGLYLTHTAFHRGSGLD